MSLIERWKQPINKISHRGEDLFSTLQSDINKLFNSAWMEHPLGELAKSLCYPRVDLKETDTEYTLKADLPGFEKKDITITLENNVLTIKGEHKNTEKYHDTDTYLYQERSSSSFERSFFISENTVDKEKVGAKFENGVLTVNLEKQHTATKDTARKIDIK